MARADVCLIEDDEIMGESLCDRFELEGIGAHWFHSAEDALEKLAVNEYAIVVSDIMLPGMSGDQLYDHLADKGDSVPPFVFITGYGSIEKAVELIKRGATDYITKPFDIDALIEKVRVHMNAGGAQAAASAQSTRLGLSPAIRAMESSLPRIAASGASVLITGESGVGKEHVARLTYALADAEAQSPFVAVNCGALTESLLEAELFGHEKGAFTGASKAKKGVFELAHGGTLFLDEIGDLPLDMQVNLLRVLQERRFARVGGEREIAVEVRMIFATNRDLKFMVHDGQFREDLFYRINVVHLHVPPLRERREDILWFARRFLDEFGEAHPPARRTLDASAERAILEYAWPGNIRELRHCIERACILNAQERLTAQMLFATTPLIPRSQGEAEGSDADADLGAYLRRCERNYILDALERHDWHIIETAQELGISRKNLWEKMKKHSLGERP